MARQVRSRPMLKTWTGVTMGETSILSTTQAALGGIGITVSSRSTLLRIRGNILVKATPDAIGDDAVAGLGIAIVSTDALVVGGTSLPGPLGDPDWPGWIWHQYVPLMAGSASLGGDDIGSFVRVPVDSKAMRKMGPNESIAVIGHLSAVTYAAVVVNGGFRFLFGEF